MPWAYVGGMIPWPDSFHHSFFEHYLLSLCLFPHLHPSTGLHSFSPWSSFLFILFAIHFRFHLIFQYLPLCLLYFDDSMTKAGFDVVICILIPNLYLHFFFLFDKWVTGRLEALLLHWFGIDSVSHALLVEWRPGLFKRTKCGIVCLITCNISGVLWVGHGFNSQKRLAWCSIFHTCWCELHLKERRTRNTHWTICLKHC